MQGLKTSDVHLNDEVIRALETMLEESHRALARERERVTVLEKKRSDRAREAELLRDEVRKLDGVIGNLNERLVDAQRRAKQGETDDEAAEQIEQRDERIAGLERRVAELSDDLQESHTRYRQREQHIDRLENNIADFAKQLQQRDQRVAELVQAVRVAERAAEIEAERARDLMKRQAPGDDLKRIRGIGPAMERKLRSAGIERFAQLAALTPQGVAALSDELAACAKRCARNDWIGQATRLAGGIG